MIKSIYTLAIYVLKYGTFALSFIHTKAKKKIEGITYSKDILRQLKQDQSKENVYIHCASQGEHEQVKPIIRWILEYTKFTIVLSFFSPSGYIHAVLEDDERMTKLYLPFDTPSEVSFLIDSIHPKLAIIVKNEWWWNLIHELHKKDVPAYLISATIREEHYFIRFPLSFFIKGLQSFASIFVVDESSKQILSKIPDLSIKIGGDTRIDQVNFLKGQNIYKKQPFEYENIDNKHRCIVYGSVWKNDIESINTIINQFPNYIHLIYPHELGMSNLNTFKDSISNSKLTATTTKANEGIHIITTMGELKYAYSEASIAYVGGGFGVGIHNVLEAAVYAIPTLFGPAFSKSNEAQYLVNEKCAYTFDTQEKLRQICDLLTKEKIRNEIESKLKAYFSPKITPTEFICKEIF